MTADTLVKQRSAILAAVLGALFSQIFGLVVGALIMVGIQVLMLGDDWLDSEAIVATSGRWDLRLFGNVFAGAMCALGGFIAVRWSRSLDLRIAAGTGVLTVILGSPIGGPPTLERHDFGRVALWALVVPLSVLGGYVAQRRMIKASDASERPSARR